jgi:hypothetical protein
MSSDIHRLKRLAAYFEGEADKARATHSIMTAGIWSTAAQHARDEVRQAEDEQIAVAWSDYRKDYGVTDDRLTEAHEAFKAGWQAAHGTLDAGGPQR